MMLPFVLTLLAAGQADVPTDDPLAQARSGQMQCYGPDLAHRTCKSLAGYVFAPDGAVTNRAEVLIAPQGPMVMQTSTSVFVRDGAVCGPVRVEDIDRARILFAGRPIEGTQAQRVKAQLKASLGQMAGAEVCTRFVPNADGYATRVTVNGSPAPEASSSAMIWVRPADGWTVGP
jgi:hypothetical protein